MRANMNSKHRWSSKLFSKAGLSLAAQEQWRQTCTGIALTLLITPLLLSLIALVTDWDLQLADSAFNFTTNTFPLRHAWLTEEFNHVILKRVLTVAAVGFLLLVIWDFISPRKWSWIRRFQFRVVALSAISIPAAISLIKLQSNSHCPWDLQRYGGAEPYVRLFESLPAGVSAGQCMPAGHASSALWLISLSIFFVPYRVKSAVSSLVIFMTLGLVVGWMQQLRGAHFMTHTLWSMWISLATLTIIVVALDRWPEPQPALNQANLTKGQHG